MVERLESIFGHGIPVLNAIIIAVWLVGTTISLTVQWSSVKQALSELTLASLTRDEKIISRLDILERDLTSKTISRWTRENHELWCVKTEQKNPEWKCGDMPAPFNPGSLEFWRSDRKTISPALPN